MPDELEDIRSYAQSFDSLLSLIPAKLYYGEDVSDQWKRKKQTPEQKRAAKLAKLDPDNWKSAKDVLDERSAAAKRKREDEEAGTDQDLGVTGELEQPKAVQDLQNPKSKKRKVENTTISKQASTSSSIEERKQKKAEKNAAKKEKIQREREKAQKQKARKDEEKAQERQRLTANEDVIALAHPILLEQTDDKTGEDVDQWSTASSSNDVPEIFSPPADSAASSISSLPVPASEQLSKAKVSKSKQKPKSIDTQQSPPSVSESIQPLIVQSAAEREAARARLANAISSFRSARKADEPTVNKPRNRAELLEQRRRKEESKRQAKKEQRRKEREEAARLEDEEIARRFSPGGSGSLLASPRSPPTKDNDSSANNFSYGRIEFADGTNVDSTTLEGLQAQRKKKGPQDAQTALQAAQNKASRLAGLDEQKRKAIEDKDMWLNAKRRAHGERVKDDTSLLKKALKRNESQKKKSEKEWSERKEGIAKAQETRQKKRTDNLAKRKEEKHDKKGGKKGKKVKRPGFEGSFRGRIGGKKKS